jgi:hypothetical protein
VEVRIKRCPHHGRRIVWDKYKDQGKCPCCEYTWHPIDIPVPPNPPPPPETSWNEPEESRNRALGFAQRTRKNLKRIEEALEDQEDVHVITQLVNSMLGLIVHPWEKKQWNEIFERVKEQRLDMLVENGWPQFQVTRGKCKTLGQLVRYLRNAVAHGHMTFNSDSRGINEVAIHLENFPNKNSPEPNWCADIRAQDLRGFCLQFVDLLEETSHRSGLG